MLNYFYFLCRIITLNNTRLIQEKIVDFIDIWSGMHLFNEIDFEI